MRIEHLKVCLNGGRNRQDHPAVPLTPAELPTRIGLEDVTVGPGGAAVSGNAELTRLARQVWSVRHRANS